MTGGSLALAFLIASIFLNTIPALAETACAPGGGSPAVIAAIEPRLEVRLADGRLVRLVGIDPASQTPSDPDRAETSRARLAAMVAGQTVSVRLLSETPDRWGRLPAELFLDMPIPGGIAAAAIAEGLGRYLAEPSAHGCREIFLGAEAKARDGKLGLWSDPYYAVLAADDPVGFAEHASTIVLVEGRLVAVLPGPYRTKLRFAPRDPKARGGRTLAAVILPRTMKTFEAQHLDFKVLIGRTMRLRGLLDQRFGPQIEVRGPDDVELIEAPHDRAGSP